MATRSTCKICCRVCRDTAILGLQQEQAVGLKHMCSLWPQGHARGIHRQTCVGMLWLLQAPEQRDERWTQMPAGFWMMPCQQNLNKWQNVHLEQKLVALRNQGFM